MNGVTKSFHITFEQEKRIEEDKTEANRWLNPTARFALKVSDVETLAEMLPEEDKNRIVADYFKLIGVKKEST